MSTEANTMCKPKRPRRDRMSFDYPCIVNGKEEDDFRWINLKKMMKHPDQEQFVG